MSSADGTKMMRILLEATGRAYADGDIPCQPDWFSPLLVSGEPVDELASHRRRLNGVLSLAESYLNAEGDVAYARLEADEGKRNSQEVADCARQADAARALLASALTAMCCEDAEFVIRGGQDELLGWIEAMSEIRKEILT